MHTATIEQKRMASIERFTVLSPRLDLMSRATVRYLKNDKLSEYVVIPSLLCQRHFSYSANFTTNLFQNLMGPIPPPIPLGGKPTPGG